MSIPTQMKQYPVPPVALAIPITQITLTVANAGTAVSAISPALTPGNVYSIGGAAGITIGTLLTVTGTGTTGTLNAAATAAMTNGAATASLPTSSGQGTNTGNQLVIGPPPGQLWRVRSLRSLYQCDATAGYNRQLAVAIRSTSLNGDLWSMVAGTIAQPSQLIEISGGGQGPPGSYIVGPANGGEGLTNVVNIGWPDMWLNSDMSLRFWVYSAYGNADFFYQAYCNVEEVSA